MVAIQAVSAQDLPEILALQKLAYRSEAEIYGDYTIPPLTQTLSSLMEDFGCQSMLKAVKDDRIIGTVRAYEKDGTCHIGRLAVHPERQGHGIGTMLMAAIETRFTTAKQYELFTGHRSIRNLHLYRKLGYRPFRTESIHHGLALIYLEKRSTNPGSQ
ncbi:N-acetyltransferase [bacterium]|nr:MAG: N-acetyltransferase [bacterium]